MLEQLGPQRLELRGLRGARAGEHGVVGGEQGVGGRDGAGADRQVGVRPLVLAGVLVVAAGAGGEECGGGEQSQGQDGPSAGGLHRCLSRGRGGAPALPMA